MAFALGKGGATKLDEFLENFQTAFDPPPSFSENYIAILSKRSKICYINFWIENDPPPLECSQKFLRFGTLTCP